MTESIVPSDLSCIPSTSDISSSSFVPPTDSEPRRSKRTKIRKDFGEDFFTYFVEGDLNSFKEAMNLSESPF